MIRRSSVLAAIVSVLTFTFTAGNAPDRTFAQPVSDTEVLSGWASSPEETAPGSSVHRLRGRPLQSG